MSSLSSSSPLSPFCVPGLVAAILLAGLLAGLLSGFCAGFLTGVVPRLHWRIRAALFRRLLTLLVSKARLRLFFWSGPLHPGASDFWQLFSLLPGLFSLPVFADCSFEAFFSPGSWPGSYRPSLLDFFSLLPVLALFLRATRVVVSSNPPWIAAPLTLAPAAFCALVAGFRVVAASLLIRSSFSAASAARWPRSLLWRSLAVSRASCGLASFGSGRLSFESGLFLSPAARLPELLASPVLFLSPADGCDEPDPFSPSLLLSRIALGSFAGIAVLGLRTFIASLLVTLIRLSRFVLRLTVGFFPGAFLLVVSGFVLGVPAGLLIAVLAFVGLVFSAGITGIGAVRLLLGRRLLTLACFCAWFLALTLLVSLLFVRCVGGGFFLIARLVSGVALLVFRLAVGG